jgi:hypothetical protein
MVMLLRSWLDQKHLTLTDFGAQIGVAATTVLRYCHPAGHRNRRMPEPDCMAAIYLATAGQVTPNDFHDLPELPATSNKTLGSLSVPSPPAGRDSSQGAARPATLLPEKETENVRTE